MSSTEKHSALRAEDEYFSVKDNGLMKDPCRSKLVVTITGMNCKPSQRHRVHGMAGWARFQCITTKDDRLVDVTSSTSLLQLDDERFRP